MVAGTPQDFKRLSLTRTNCELRFWQGEQETELGSEYRVLGLAGLVLAIGLCSDGVCLNRWLVQYCQLSHNRCQSCRGLPTSDSYGLI